MEELGLCHATGWKRFAYSTVADRIKNLEDKLAAGLYDGGTPRDLQWLTRCLLKASIPPNVLHEIADAAVDETPVRTWSLPTDGKYASQDKFNKAVQARFNEYEADNPHVPEAELRVRALEDEAQQWGLEVGEDARIIRCKDLDARTGWATATSKTKADYYIGYGLTLVVACRSAAWSGDPDEIKLGPKIPRYILALSLNPAGGSQGDIGRRTVKQARKIAPNLYEILADRGYTTKAEKFLRPLHKLGMNVVMDYTKTAIDRPKTITIGRSSKTRQQVVVNCGVILPGWINNYWRKPPPHIKADKEKLAKWHRARAQMYRWADKGHVKRNGKPTGAKRFQDPVTASRVTLPASPKPASYRTPLVAAPSNAPLHVGGTVIIQVEDLDYYQQVAYGTRAWMKSYARRNTVESTNSSLKKDEGLDPENCQAFGLAAHTMAAVVLAVVHNLKQTEKAEAKAKKAKNADNDDSGDKAVESDKAGNAANAQADEAIVRHDGELVATAGPADNELLSDRAPP